MYTVNFQHTPNTVYTVLLYSTEGMHGWCMQPCNAVAVMCIVHCMQVGGHSGCVSNVQCTCTIVHVKLSNYVNLLVKCITHMLSPGNFANVEEN